MIGVHIETTSYRMPVPRGFNIYKQVDTSVSVVIHSLNILFENCGVKV
jgi:hypothetical protein